MKTNIIKSTALKSSVTRGEEKSWLLANIFFSFYPVFDKQRLLPHLPLTLIHPSSSFWSPIVFFLPFYLPFLPPQSKDLVTFTWGLAVNWARCKIKGESSKSKACCLHHTCPSRHCFLHTLHPGALVIFLHS